jgi:hypothetical protein
MPTKEEVYVAKGLKDRKMQRALMQFFGMAQLRVTSAWVGAAEAAQTP